MKKIQSILVKHGVYHDGQVKMTETINDVKNNTKVIVLFVDNDDVNERAIALAVWQDLTGFAKNVLANPTEDIWNDL